MKRVINDSALTTSEMDTLRAAGYTPGGGGVDGNQIVVKFAKAGQLFSATRAEWRAIAAELPKPENREERMTNAKTTQRITWNETTFDADALHLTMIDQINRLIRVIGARTKVLRASVARERRLCGACEEALAIAENRQDGNFDTIMLLMRAALADEGEERPE